MGQGESAKFAHDDEERDKDDDVSSYAGTDDDTNEKQPQSDEQRQAAIVLRKQKEAEKFKRKGKSKPSQDDSGRVPPGQKLSKTWPVMDIGSYPDMDLSKWKLEISGECMDAKRFFSLEELKQISHGQYETDFHCVTMWSKLDMQWMGISLVSLINLVRPDPKWRFLIQHGADGYTTNVPRDDVERDDVFIAYECNGKPIPKMHGTVRIIIPHLYGWKGSKWLTKIEFVEEDQPGFWEVRGYHSRGDAWAEERLTSY